MADTEKDQALDTPKPAHRKKSTSKAAANGTESTGEKKRKAPKAGTAQTSADYEHVEEENTDVPAADQEVPTKPKKKRAPKADAQYENNEILGSEEPVKKKKSKAPKAAPIDDEFQMIDASAVDDVQPYVEPEPKPKTKKPKKSKRVSEAQLDSFEELQVTNLDDYNPENGDAVPEMYAEDFPPSNGATGTSDSQQAIVDSFADLQSKMNFAQYVGDDSWCIINKPKSARGEPKSRLRKILPSSLRDDNKSTSKPGVQKPKPKLFNRFRTSVTTMVRDPNNIIFGEQPTHDLNLDPEEEEIDTDSLHRYAQKLRELEDQDREINPEFLVLQDGKTVYGVHEEDTDGKVKLSKRKPIYDRAADQKPEDAPEKRKLLSRLKAPFSRSKDGKDSKSATATPDTRADRKSSRKSLNNVEMTIAAGEDPILI